MNRFKYGRTYHLPFSKTVADDDKMHPYLRHFNGGDLVVTVKMDGENSALYQDGFTHARSMDSVNHESRDWLKRFWSDRSYLLPAGWRIYGENLYAKHSIEYNDLRSYFQVFAVYDDNNMRLDWDAMKSLCSQLDMDMVTVVLRTDSFNWLQEVETVFNQVVASGEEGIVLTMEKGYHFDDMSLNVAKAVREGHVKTEDHWMHRAIVKNGLKND